MEARLVGSANVPETVEYEVEVPEGVSPKDAFSTTLPNGRNILVICPEGATAGSMLTISVPIGDPAKTPPMYEVTIPEGVKPGETFEITLPNGLIAKVVCPEDAKEEEAVRFQGPNEHKMLNEMILKSKEKVQMANKFATAAVAKASTTMMDKEKRNQAYKEAKEAAMKVKTEDVKKKAKSMLGKGLSVTKNLAGKAATQAAKSAKYGGAAKKTWDGLSEKQKRAIYVVALTYMGVPKPALMLASYDAIGAVIDITKKGKDDKKDDENSGAGAADKDNSTTTPNNDKSPTGAAA